MEWRCYHARAPSGRSSIASARRAVVREAQRPVGQPPRGTRCRIRTAAWRGRAEATCPWGGPMARPRAGPRVAAPRAWCSTTARPCSCLPWRRWGRRGARPGRGRSRGPSCRGSWRWRRWARQRRRHGGFAPRRRWVSPSVLGVSAASGGKFAESLAVPSMCFARDASSCSRGGILLLLGCRGRSRGDRPTAEAEVEVHGILVDGFAGLSEIPSLVLFSLIFLGRKGEVPKGSDPRVVDKSARHTAAQHWLVGEICFHFISVLIKLTGFTVREILLVDW